MLLNSKLILDVLRLLLLWLWQQRRRCRQRFRLQYRLRLLQGQHLRRKLPLPKQLTRPSMRGVRTLLRIVTILKR